MDFKNELESLVEEQQKQLKSKSIKVNHLSEAMQIRAEDLEKKEMLLARLSKVAEDNK